MPIGLHSEIYNVGLIMLSLIKGEVQQMPLAGDRTWPFLPVNRCYSSKLHTAVKWCMSADQQLRPTVKELLKSIKEGFEAWEQTYGTADREDSPEFMKYHLHVKEQFEIGEKAPTDGNRQKRKAERIGDEMENHAQDGSPSPSKKRRTGSQSTPVDPNSPHIGPLTLETTPKKQRPKTRDPHVPGAFPDTSLPNSVSADSSPTQSANLSKSSLTESEKSDSEQNIESETDSEDDGGEDDPHSGNRIAGEETPQQRAERIAQGGMYWDADAYNEARAAPRRAAVFEAAQQRYRELEHGAEQDGGDGEDDADSEVSDGENGGSDGEAEMIDEEDEDLDGDEDKENVGEEGEDVVEEQGEIEGARNVFDAEDEGRDETAAGNGGLAGFIRGFTDRRCQVM